MFNSSSITTKTLVSDYWFQVSCKLLKSTRLIFHFVYFFILNFVSILVVTEEELNIIICIYHFYLHHSFSAKNEELYFLTVNLCSVPFTNWAKVGTGYSWWDAVASHVILIIFCGELQNLAKCTAEFRKICHGKLWAIVTSLIGVSTLNFLQCFDTVSWMTVGHPACKKPVLLIVTGSVLEQVQEEKQG